MPYTWPSPLPGPQTNAWRLSEVNEDFSVCPSYPRAVIVPRSVDDGALARSARFRQGGRFPVLSYHHAPSGTVSPPLPRLCLLDQLRPFLALFCTGPANSQRGCRRPAPTLFGRAQSCLQQAPPPPAFLDSDLAPLPSFGVSPIPGPAPGRSGPLSLVPSLSTLDSSTAYSSGPFPL